MEELYKEIIDESTIGCIWGNFNNDKFYVCGINNPIKELLGNCKYENVEISELLQIDNDNFDINKISQYDTRMQVGTLKHNLLLNGSKQVYENERRRIKRKAIWFKGKEKYNEKVCEM